MSYPSSRQRGREERQQPQARHSQLLQIIQLAEQAGKIADAVAVAVGKAAHVQLIQDRILIPERVRSANLAVHSPQVVQMPCCSH